MSALVSCLKARTARPQAPGLDGWRAGRPYAEDLRKIEGFNVRPPGVEIVDHQLHHEVTGPVLLVIAL